MEYPYKHKFHIIRPVDHFLPLISWRQLSARVKTSIYKSLHLTVIIIMLKYREREKKRDHCHGTRWIQISFMLDLSPSLKTRKQKGAAEGTLRNKARNLDEGGVGDQFGWLCS